MAITVYSLGYEKKTIDEFIEKLKTANVSILLDVREYAWSYKQNFRKNKLSTSLSQAGIEYIHVPSAGNPKNIRKKYVKPETVLKKYKVFLQNTGSGMEELKNAISKAKKLKKNICLTCFEKDHQSCHRSILLDELKKELPKLSVKHI